MIRSNVRPMSLGNMRANGVGSLLVYCFACHHEVVFGVEDYPDDMPVPAFSPRMVCTRCGMIGADARPNWSERRGYNRSVAATSEAARSPSLHAANPRATR